MAIANSYFNSSPITDSDIFVGTKYTTNRTVNYTAQSIADYLNINSRISISGQLTFKFTILPNVAKTIAFENGGGDGRLFSSIDKLIVSILDAGGSNITVFLDYLVDGEILLAEQNQPNSFGHYKITSYTVTANPNFYELNLEYIGGNGNIYKDVYYDMTPWVGSGSIGTIPNLQQVTDEGNTTTNGIIINSNNLLGQSFKVTDPLNSTSELYSEILTIISSNGTASSYANGALTLGDLNLDITNPVNLSVINDTTYYGVGLLLNSSAIIQDASLIYHPDYFIPQAPATSPSIFYIPYKLNGTYTLATLDDIPSYTIPTFQDVVTAGNIITTPFTSTNGNNENLFTWEGISAIDLLNNTTISYTFNGIYRIENSFQQEIVFAPVTSNETITIPSATGTLALTSDIPTIGTWGALNYPTWTAGTPFVKMTAAGTFALDTNTYLTSAVTSVGLTMPSAFMVTNSPITSSGDIAVTGAGAVSQYVRGDGTLANFPTSSGGGSSLSFYLNGSVSQGTIGGVAFREMDRTPILGVGTDFTINANGYIQSFITDAGVPNLLEIPAGNWNFETYFSASSGGGSPSFYVELYKWDGTTLSLIASNSANPEFITGGTNTDLYVSALAVPQTTLLATDRLAIRIYVTHSGRTIKLHTEDNHLCQVITTFSTGLTALNGLTAQVQNLAVGTTGTDFGIVSSGSTHTFNIPNASATNDRGLLTSANWTTFNNKQNTATLIFDSLQKAIMRDNYFWFVPNTISTGVAAGFGYSERLGGNTFTLSNNGTLLRGLVPFNTTIVPGILAFMRKNDAMILTGLEVVFTRKIQFNSNVSGQRFYCGISKGNQFSAPTNVEPSTLTDIVGVCQLSSSTNMHVVHNDASGTATTIDLGSSYPCTDSQYNYFITIEQTTTSYIVTVERVTISTGASISTTNILTTNIPVYNTGTIQLLTWISNNATAAIASYLDGGAIGNVKNQ